MNPLVENLTQNELQAVILHFGSMTKFYEWLGVSPTVGRDFVLVKKLLSSFDYVRSLSREELVNLLVDNSFSIKKTAVRLGVSSSFLKSVFRAHYTPIVVDDWVSSATADKLQAELKRVGSIAILSRVTGSSESALRKACQEHGIVVPENITYHGTKFAAGKGRKAELAYAKLRGSRIVEDLNEKKTSNEAVDFKDADFGSVDVKGSKKFFTLSTQDAYWKFTLEYSPEVSNYAFLCFDRTFEKVEWWFVLNAVFFKVKNGAFTFLVQENLKKFIRLDPERGAPCGLNYASLRQFTNIMKDDGRLPI